MVLLPQPVSKTMIDASKSTGGNAMGLRSRAQLCKPLLLDSSSLEPGDANQAQGFTINLGWVQESDDATISAILNETLALIESLTKARGLYDPFLFFNDAHSTQPVIRSYGVINVQRLQATAKEYDPLRMFQYHVPGGFKLI